MTVFKVERGLFDYKGKQYNEYFISGTVRGTEVKIKLAPPDKKDKGGYTVLDIVFGNENEADFVTCGFPYLVAYDPYGGQHIFGVL